MLMYLFSSFFNANLMHPASFRCIMCFVVLFQKFLYDLQIETNTFLCVFRTKRHRDAFYEGKDAILFETDTPI